MPWFPAVHGEKTGACKANKVGIFKPALLCRDCPFLTLAVVPVIYSCLDQLANRKPFEKFKKPEMADE